MRRPQLCHTLVIVALLLAGCERAPAEPEPIAREAPAATRPPLSWTPPPTWKVEHIADRGSLRARYSIPKAGSASTSAELLVMRLEGSEADVDAKLTELQAQFEGVERGKRETLKIGALEVTLLEVAGTYRMPVGPAMGQAKKHAAHMLKEDWRALAAAVKTKNRGTWMFRLLGPSDAVAAARGPFRTMVDGMH